MLNSWMTSMDGRKAGDEVVLSLLSIPLKVKLLACSAVPETLKPPRNPLAEPCAGGITPGTRVESDHQTRPFNGISTTLVLSTTAPSSDDAVLMLSTAPETVTFSETLPSSRVTSRRRFCATARLML